MDGRCGSTTVRHVLLLRTEVVSEGGVEEASVGAVAVGKRGESIRTEAALPSIRARRYLFRITTN